MGRRDTHLPPVEALRHHVEPLRGRPEDYDRLLQRVGDASVVLLGEATHGSHEFYRARLDITRRLVQERGFSAVAVEADWPDAYRVHRYVQGLDGDHSAADALDGFGRFPLWMWRNNDVVELVDWLSDHNRRLPREARVGFYGLDLYSLFGSIRAVTDYLDRVDPRAADEARHRYACLDSAGDEAQGYGYGVHFGLHPSCEDQVVEQLMSLREGREQARRRDGLLAEDEHFAAEQNARVILDAERYYRAMFDRYENTWNLRDQHMLDTLDSLKRHLERSGRGGKIVVWEHNSHVGDARATEMSRRGEHNVGQLARRRYGDDAVLVGFTTHTGTVTCSSRWDGPIQRKRVRPSAEGSWERLFHEVGAERFYLDTAAVPLDVPAALLERAIGVIYLPHSERASHYFQARLADQFDAVFHFDHTRALEPLDRTAEWERGEAPQTYPSGM